MSRVKAPSSSSPDAAAAVSTAAVRRARLRRSKLDAPGIVRRRAGKGFTYVAPDGAKVTDVETMARIVALAIPPAWTDVWICTDPMGHIQAMGTDARGRRQYRYHDRWRARRDRQKFEKMLEFAAALPRMRAAAAEHLTQDGLTRERVLACAVRLLDVGFFRIGTEGYAEENQTYGLATMERRHVRLVGDTVVFDYTAKSGKRRIQSVVDPDVLDVVSELKQRRTGRRLLAFRNDEGGWCEVRSAEINAYIKEIGGSEFSAKDFRTWSATVLAAVALAVTAPSSPTARKRLVARACKEVAEYLGNTPAVCRSSYIDPRVVDRFQAGATIAPALELLGKAVPEGALSTHGAVELAVLELLDEREVETTDLLHTLDMAEMADVA